MTKMKRHGGNTEVMTRMNITHIRWAEGYAKSHISNVKDMSFMHLPNEILFPNAIDDCQSEEKVIPNLASTLALIICGYRCHKAKYEIDIRLFGSYVESFINFAALERLKRADKIEDYQIKEHRSPLGYLLSTLVDAARQIRRVPSNFFDENIHLAIAEKEGSRIDLVQLIRNEIFYIRH